MAGRDPAEIRLWQMTMVRLAGLLLALGGLVLLGRAGGGSAGGAVLMLLGAIVTLLAPKWLNRRWRR